MGEATIRPVYMKYGQSYFSPAYDVLEMFTLILFTLCCANNNLTCVVGVLPDFQPNEYFFTTHADKGPERWQIYAWAVRDALSKASGLPTCDMSSRVQKAYYSYLCEEKGCIDVAKLSIDEIIEKTNFVEPKPADKKN